MKKLLAVVLAIASFAFAAVAPVTAQNNPSSYTAWTVGAPGYNLNSAGSSFGQFQNVSSSVWALGTGTSQTAIGTSVLYWNASNQAMVGTSAPLSNALLQVGSNNNAVIVKTNGELEFKSVAPAVSSCGSSPTVASGNDMAGDVTLGSAGVTTCTITFANAFTNKPHCVVNNNTTKLATIAQPSATALVIVGTGAGAFGNAGDELSWLCFGHQ